MEKKELTRQGAYNIPSAKQAREMAKSIGYTSKCVSASALSQSQKPSLAKK